jgi:uncharacterized protein (TIGR03663 family)
MLMVIALFKFIDDRKEIWLYVGAAALTLSLCTKETAYIFGFIGLSFLVVVYIWEKISPSLERAVYGVGVLAVVLLLGIAGFLQATGNVGLLPHTILLAGFGVSVLVAGQLRGAERRLTDAQGDIHARMLLNCAIIAAIIFSLLFTTFFTNPKGLISGVVGSVSYWLGQHGVQRGGQPWYYYILLLLPLYEFLPLLFALVGLAYYLFRNPRDAVRSEHPGPESLTGGRGLFVSFLAYWAIMSLLL